MWTKGLQKPVNPELKIHSETLQYKTTKSQIWRMYKIDINPDKQITI